QVIDEEANFIADATEICKGSNINFSSININEANIQNWSWDFGDGTKSSVVNNVNHTYKTSGNFQVTLTVTDLLGCTNSYSLPVNVFGPAANFEPGVPGVCLGTSAILFNDLSSGDGIHSITKWNWNYGDGSVDSNSIAPYSHFYSQAG